MGSRIPQIRKILSKSIDGAPRLTCVPVKNFTTKCEGLSLALFMFAIAGNVTYVLSICTDSMDRQHLVANAPWLAGECEVRARVPQFRS